MQNSNQKFDLHSRARECLAHSPPLPRARCGSAQRIFQSPPLTNRRPRSYFLIVLALVAKQLGRRGMQPSERIFGETEIAKSDDMQRCRDGLVFGPKVTFACTKIHPDHRWLSLNWRSRTERKTIWIFFLPPSFGPESSISSASFHAALFPFHLLVVWVVPMPKRGCFMPCTRVDHCWLLPDRRRNGGLAILPRLVIFFATPHNK